MQMEQIIKQIDHIGIAVRDLEAALKDYERLFKVRPVHTEVRDDLHVRVAFIPIGEAMIELLEPTVPGMGRIGEFIASHGEGLHHVAYRVGGDIGRIHEDMKQAGIALRDEEPRLGANGSRIVFVSPEETRNVLTELVERGREA